MTKELVLNRNKYGINLILDKDTPFPKLLEAITEKFKETGTFFKDAKMAVSFEGRELTPEEEQRILDVITANSSIQIVCVMENGTALEEKMKARIEAREAEAANSYPYMEAENAGADFYKGNLRFGQVVESYSSITLIGDVNPGAKIISQGNIVILGSLKGNAHAGATGDSGCFIFALEMKPIQLQIGEYIAKSPDKEKGGRGLRKRESTAANAYSPQIATAKEETICIEPVTRGRLNNLF